MGLRLYRYGHQDPDLDLIRRLLIPGDLFVDGGANIGLFTLVGAAAVGASGQVIAFEPAETTRRSLIRNVALNGFTWVSVRAEALGSESASRRFVVFDGDASGLSSFSPETGQQGGTVTAVETRAIDEILVGPQRDRLALVKLDLEGAEVAALVGARAILELGQADVLVEIEPEHLARQGASAVDLIALLRGHGYDFYRATWNAQGRVELRRDTSPELRADTPNLFATKTAARARRAGIDVIA
jgi:FkbM family methyltransferase